MTEKGNVQTKWETWWVEVGGLAVLLGMKRNHQGTDV
jgi:hypothetical protein